MTLQQRRFHIGDIISVVTGVMVAPGNLNSVRRLLEHMTNRKLMDFQLPEATRLAEPSLREAFPWLEGITAEALKEIPVETLRVWLMEMGSQHGQSHLVHRLPEGTWVDRDPIQELKARMKPGTPLLTVLRTDDGRYVVLDGLEPGDIRNPPFDPEG